MKRANTFLSLPSFSKPSERFLESLFPCECSAQVFQFQFGNRACRDPETEVEIKLLFGAILSAFLQEFSESAPYVTPKSSCGKSCLLTLSTGSRMASALFGANPCT